MCEGNHSASALYDRLNQIRALCGRALFDSYNFTENVARHSDTGMGHLAIRNRAYEHREVRLSGRVTMRSKRYHIWNQRHIGTRDVQMRLIEMRYRLGYSQPQF